MSQSQNETDILTKVKPKKIERYKVLMLNDDFTPMNFVVVILQTIFEKSLQEAEFLMQMIHTKKKAVVGIYAEKEADQKIDMVHNEAKKNGFPLKCIKEKV